MELPTEAQLANDVISTIRAGKVVELGIQLGLSQDEIEATCTKDLGHFKQYMTMFNKWKHSGEIPYTWESLVKALKAPSVREMALARKLQRKYCSRT